MYFFSLNFFFSFSLLFSVLTKLEINTNECIQRYTPPWLPSCIEANTEWIVFYCAIHFFFYFVFFPLCLAHSARSLSDPNYSILWDKQNSRQWKIVVNNWTTTLTRITTKGSGGRSNTKKQYIVCMCAFRSGSSTASAHSLFDRRSINT